MQTIKNLVFIISSLCILQSCASSNKVDLKYWGGKVNLANNINPNEKRWEVKANKLYLNGNIIEGDCKRVEKLLSPNIDELVVNSQGGDVSQSICISNKIDELSSIAIVNVEGLCWSSCANYLFLGRKTRVINNGSVGFHGNFTALFNSSIPIQNLNSLAINKKLTESQISSIRDFLGFEKGKKNLNKNEEKKAIEVLNKFRATLLLENEFMNKKNIRQDLFNLTQAPDKGEENGKMFMFLIPSPDFFKKYGFKIESGENSEGFVRMFNSRQPIPLLYK